MSTDRVVVVVVIPPMPGASVFLVLVGPCPGCWCLPRGDKQKWLQLWIRKEDFSFFTLNSDT